MNETPRNNHVTIRDVAQAAGVSISTVSRTFARPGRVSATMAEHIRQVADDMGYRSGAVTTQAPIDSTALKSLLAITVADIANPIFADYIKSAQRQCMRKGFGLIVIDSEETGLIERTTMRIVYDHVDGFILASSRTSDAAIRKIAEIKPVVTLNRPVQGLQSIVSDPSQGLSEAIDHLVDMGHTSITYLSGPDASWQNGMRWRILHKLCAEHDLKLKRIPCMSPTYDGGCRAVQDFLKSPTSAVIAYNDNVATGFIAVLKAKGKRVPQDVSVIGTDDLPISSLLDPPLSTIHLLRRELGEQAVDELVARLHHTATNLNLKPIMIPSTFVERGTVGLQSIAA